MLTFANVTVVYRHRTEKIVAVEDLTFSVERGEFLCILGPSGCGKSTVVHLAGGFIFPESGEVICQGKIIKGAGKDRGVVFQQHNLFPWKTVSENIEFGPRMNMLPKSQRQRIIQRYLASMDLTEFAHSYPAELSVGMKQRVGLARAFANDPQVILMDEPFASLDAQTAMRMQELLNHICSQNNKTVVFVTHDIAEAIHLGDRILVLTARPGRVEKEFRVDIPRPRTKDTFSDARFLSLHKALLDCVFGGR